MKIYKQNYLLNVVKDDKDSVAEISADSNEKFKLFTVTWPYNMGYYKGLLRVSGNEHKEQFLRTHQFICLVKFPSVHFFFYYLDTL